MRRLTRLALPVALLVLCWHATASALTVSPSGNYTVSSGTTTLRFLSNGQTLTCTSSRIRAVIGSNGTGSIPAGSALFSGCTNALTGPFTIVQPVAWPLRVVLVPQASGGALVGLEVTIPPTGVRITNGNCSFTVTGTTLKGRVYPGPLPVTVNTTDIFSFLRTSLRVDSVANCSPLITTMGLAASFAGSYTMSRSALISG